MTDKSKPMTERELEALFEEKKHEIGSYLEDLKSRDDYCTQGACDAMESIMYTFYYLLADENYQKICSRLVDFMLQQGLAQLIVKSVKSTGKVAFDFRCNISLLVTHLVTKMRNTNRSVATKVSVELIKNGMIGSLIKELDSYDPNTQDTKQRILITTSLYDLHNLLSAPNAIPIYRAANAVNTLMKFAESDNVMTRIDSLRVLAKIVNEKESQRIAASGECIVTLMDTIHKAAQSDDRKCKFVFNIDGKQKGFRTTLGVVLATVNNLANNDANKESIIQHGGLPTLTAILRPEYTDTEKWQAVEGLWKLSFLESNLDVIVAHFMYTDTTALQALKEMRSSEYIETSNASQGLLHNLGLVGIHEEPPVEQQSQPASRSPSSSAQAHPRQPPPSYQETMDAPHIMISYKWSEQKRAIRVKEELEKTGFKVWIDVDQVEGNILVAMANAVEKADAILVCVSRSYKASVNCQAEAHYAYQQQKPIIPLMVEEDYKPDGWLGMMIAMKKYIRAYSDEVLQKDMPDLLRELRKSRADKKV
ncbi:uncharacterized protein [Amphiura filiformis]|uniref:uncharacterized protein n=1 Tax=Amphiura filiformis TaxID=82378 RepID=UPI003B21C47F